MTRCNGEQPGTFPQMASDIAEAIIAPIHARAAADGRRPIYAGQEKFQTDPYWRDLILFYEYFHGDNGAGLGAATRPDGRRLVAALIDEWRQ